MTIQDKIYAHELEKLARSTWQLYVMTCRDTWLPMESKTRVEQTLSRIYDQLQDGIKALGA